MARRSRILLIDDDRELAQLVSDLLAMNGFDVAVATDAQDAREKLSKSAYDLLISDVMMPGGSGLDFCRDVRSRSKVPIIMLTALSGLVDRVIGLELGADDYVTKPFESRELLARVRALLRRVDEGAGITQQRPSMLAFGEWRLDLAKGELRRSAGVLVPLTAVELRVVRAFAERPGVIMSRDWLSEVAETDAGVPRSRSIDVLVSRLRAKMSPHDQGRPAIETVRGGGYVLRVHAPRLRTP